MAHQNIKYDVSNCAYNDNTHCKTKKETICNSFKEKE